MISNDGYVSWKVRRFMAVSTSVRSMELRSGVTADGEVAIPAGVTSVAGQAFKSTDACFTTRACISFHGLPFPIRRRRNHFKKNVVKPDAGKPHERLKGGWETGPLRGSCDPDFQ